MTCHLRGNSETAYFSTLSQSWEHSRVFMKLKFPLSNPAMSLTFRALLECQTSAFCQQAEHWSRCYLPIKRIGRGPNLSIRMPSGSVVALSRKLPMVKPKFNISSWSTQLGHASVSSLAVEFTVAFSAAKVYFCRQTLYIHSVRYLYLKQKLKNLKINKTVLKHCWLNSLLKQ